MGEGAMRLGTPPPLPSSSREGDFGFGSEGAKKESLTPRKKIDALRASCPC